MPSPEALCFWVCLSVRDSAFLFVGHVVLELQKNDKNNSYGLIVFKVL